MIGLRVQIDIFWINICLIVGCYGQRLEITNINPLSANPTKWPNTLKQIVGRLPTNCLSVFGHFVNLALKGLIWMWICVLNINLNQFSVFNRVNRKQLKILKTSLEYLEFYIAVKWTWFNPKSFFNNLHSKV